MATIYQSFLSDSNLWSMLFRIDEMEADRVKSQGCPVCGGVLDCGHYPRQPRGLSFEISFAESQRHSFCCRACRKRTRPESVRFLERKWYVFFVVILSLYLRGSRGALGKLRALRALCGVSESTIYRWIGWIEAFSDSQAGRQIASRFPPPFNRQRFIVSLIEQSRRVYQTLQDVLRQACKWLSILSVSALEQERLGLSG